MNRKTTQDYKKVQQKYALIKNNNYTVLMQKRRVKKNYEKSRIKETSSAYTYYTLHTITIRA
jgi:hypothetical protein